MNTKPQYDGEINLAGLESNVTIKYDTYGIPHIYAENESDAYFALGYVHAQERLFSNGDDQTGSDWYAIRNLGE